MTEPDDSNPYRSPQVQDTPAEERRLLSRISYRAVAILQSLTIAIGVPLACWEIETILGSGAILFSFGLLSLAMALRAKFMAGIVFGASGPLMTLGCFVLINVKSWGPSDAQDPIAGLAVVYAFTFGLLGFWTLFRSVPKQPQSQIVEQKTSPWENRL